MVNPTSFVRDDLVFIAETGLGTLRRADGTPVLTQEVDGGTLVAAGSLEPYSATPLQSGDETETPASELSVSEGELENAFVRIELNEDGDLTRVFDKTANRDVLADGAKGNEFLAFERPPERLGRLGRGHLLRRQGSTPPSLPRPSGLLNRGHYGRR